MDIKKARKILKEDGENCTDNEIQEYIDTASLLADIAIDKFKQMTTEERNKLLSPTRQG